MDELLGDVGLEDHENQSLVNSERSSIQRALEPPDLTTPSLDDHHHRQQDNHNIGKSFHSSWFDRITGFRKTPSRSNLGYQTAAPDDH
jgi:sterol desaturase/sphingolipid hydroxylase (fatty acid hydroxylase superfamily)